MNKNNIFIFISILIMTSQVSKAQNDTLKIITTSSSIYSQVPETSIYPAFVDNMPYQSWTLSGSKPYYQLIAKGGQKPYKWDLAKGSLPDGIVLTSAGKLEGTPTKEGKFIFVIKVADAQGKMVQKQLDFVAEPYRSKWLTDAKFGVWYQLSTAIKPALYTKEDIKIFEDRIKNFDAEKYASAVAEMGGKVLNCSVKGGDGIRMWPSTTPSRYELKTSRNIVKELIAACHKRNIKLVGYFAPDHTWNKKINDTAKDGTLGTLNKGLIKELIEMGVDGFWIDMGGTPEMYKDQVDPRWFPWNEILPMARTLNPHIIFSNNPGLGNGGVVLRWPDTDVLVYEGYTGAKETALVVAKPAIVKKKVAIEVDNLLDTTWSWIPEKKYRKPKSATTIIQNIKANWAVGATYMLDIPVAPDGEIANEDYAPVLAKIGKFVKAAQNKSAAPIPSLSANIAYDSVQTLSLKAENNAKVYYTTDGSIPSTKSKLYKSPLQLTKSTIIKAVSIEPGKAASEVYNQTFTFKGKSIKNSGRVAITKNISNKKATSDKMEYYRGMQIIIGPNPIIIEEIGRQFVTGNRNIHNIIIKRVKDDYPLLTVDLDTKALKTQPDGFQYVAVQPLTLTPGLAYIIAAREDSIDKFMPDDFNGKMDNPSGIRIVNNSILTSTGDRKPIIDDQIGSILNLKYKIDSTKTPVNLAIGAQAFLLDNDDKPTVSTFMGIHHPQNGVDGILSTRAQAGGKYAWTYKIDLGKESQGIRKSIIDFTANAFATDFELSCSSDNITWKPLAHIKDNSLIHHTFQFKPVQARYFRIKALKPDGPNQKGGGMSVAEFQLYK